jgi:dihydropteroate synthase
VSGGGVERLLFVTGRLAASRLRGILAGLGETPFAWEVVDIGVKVAALMTEPIILRRLARPVAADRIVLPGRAGVDPARLSAALGVAVERGPDELADLPRYLGRGGRPPDLSRHDVRIFAELIDAPTLAPDTLLARARQAVAEGADVIDLGCKPGTPFPGLEAAVAALQGAGLRVSVDSGDPAELRRGALAGADYLLSLTEHTLDVLDGTAAVPVLIPATHGDVESLLRAAAAMDGRPCLLDPILDPVHFGFTDSLGRYAAVRAALPQAEMLMGTGNLTELTDADSAGVTAMLMAVCSELFIRNVLVVQVSPHTRRTIAEHDAARRLMYAARADGELPRNYGPGLLQVHDRAPWTLTDSDVAAQAEAVRDRNWRIAVTEGGVHAWSAGRHLSGTDVTAFYPALDVATDGAHGFYLGGELARAEIAHRLGKRYVQDEPLDFGVAAPVAPRDRTRLAEEGHTLRARSAGTAPESAPETAPKEEPEPREPDSADDP